MKVGIIICARYGNCGGGKCLRALKEHSGGFSAYPLDEPLELVGYGSCGGCPGGNMEYVPEEMIKNGAQVIHFATGLVVGYPPCPYIRDFQAFIQSRYQVRVIVGTHPIPMKYYQEQVKLPFWGKAGLKEIAPELFNDEPNTMLSYD